MKRVHQTGFAALELILLIVMIGIIAFVAWRVIEANGAVDQAANSVPQTTVVPESTKASVTPASKSDLDTLTKQMDNTNVDGTTSTDLSKQSAF